MSATLGFFEQFKGADTVLLSTNQGELLEMAERLERFASSRVLFLEIEAVPISGHEAHLVAVRESHAPANQRQFHWLCGPRDIPEILEKLRHLAKSTRGHQYFDLLGTNAQLLVSVGEYRANALADV